MTTPLPAQVVSFNAQYDAQRRRDDAQGDADHDGPLPAVLGQAMIQLARFGSSRNPRLSGIQAVSQAPTGVLPSNMIMAADRRMVASFVRALNAR